MQRGSSSCKVYAVHEYLRASTRPSRHAFAPAPRRAVANILLCYNTELRMLYDKYWWVLRRPRHDVCSSNESAVRPARPRLPRPVILAVLNACAQLPGDRVERMCPYCAPCLPCSKRPSHQLPSKLPRLSFSVLAAQESGMPLTSRGSHELLPEFGLLR